MQFEQILVQLVDALTPDRWIELRTVSKNLYESINHARFIHQLKFRYVPDSPAQTFWQVVFWYRVMMQEEEEYYNMNDWEYVPKWYLQQLRSGNVTATGSIIDDATIEQTISTCFSNGACFIEMFRAATLDLAVSACLNYPLAADPNYRITDVKSCLDAVMSKSGVPNLTPLILLSIRLEVDDMASVQTIYNTYTVTKKGNSRLPVSELTERGVQWLLDAHLYENYDDIIKHHSCDTKIIGLMVSKFGYDNGVDWTSYVSHAVTNYDYEALKLAIPYKDKVNVIEVVMGCCTYAEPHLLFSVLDVQLDADEFVEKLNQETSPILLEYMIEYHFKGRIDWWSLSIWLLGMNTVTSSLMACIMTLDFKFNSTEALERWSRK